MEKVRLDNMATDPAYVHFRKVQVEQLVRGSNPLTRVCKRKFTRLGDWTWETHPCYLRWWDTWGVGNLVRIQGAGKGQISNGTNPAVSAEAKRLRLEECVTAAGTRGSIVWSSLVWSGESFWHRLSAAVEDRSSTLLLGEINKDVYILLPRIALCVCVCVD
jgi:hypothetical protein